MLKFVNLGKGNVGNLLFLQFFCEFEIISQSLNYFKKLQNYFLNNQY